MYNIIFLTHTKLHMHTKVVSTSVKKVYDRLTTVLYSRQAKARVYKYTDIIIIQSR